ncbi:hypothetical protein DPMN_095687 [Dreissena polymorpha]|uniref:Uncharacterized protein n=1 Tax=Dreissena polymorpha TaxID=45954 RepID=A0A9D4L828_DREPO|nr:hypothetical protein DPMN_095687 [Dreissena polymorpha]
MALGSGLFGREPLSDLKRFCLSMGYTPKGESGNPSQIQAAGAIARLTGEEAGAFVGLFHWSVLVFLTSS